MATMKVSIPGIGGSLGECVLCGEAFITEILLGQNVRMIGIEGFASDLPAHIKCSDELNGVDWHTLPEKSPLRKVFEEAEAEAAAPRKDSDK